MNPRNQIPHELRQLARSQAGALSRTQILGHGVPHWTIGRCVEEGHFRKLATGIYLTSPLDPSWLALTWAGILIGGPEAAIAGVGAARLWGLTDDEPAPIPVLVPASSKRSVGQHWQFRRTRIPFRIIGSPPRLSVERTIVDLCSDSPDRSEHWITRAVGQGRTTVDRLRAELSQTPRHPARKRLEQLLGDVKKGAHSRLELVYLRDVERAHGLPEGRRQVRSGGYRIDVYYREGLVTELDGRLGHSDSDVFRDMDRDNFHTLQGLVNLRFGWAQCNGSPCSAAAQVAQALTSLGWTGQMRACPRCHLG